MTHNANEVLRSSRKLHSDLTGGTLKANQMAAREVQLAIRNNLPAYGTAAGKFKFQYPRVDRFVVGGDIAYAAAYAYKCFSILV